MDRVPICWPLVTGAVTCSSSVTSVVTLLFWALSMSRPVASPSAADTVSCRPSFTGTPGTSLSSGEMTAKFAKP